MFSWSKILGVASVAVATALLGMVAFDVPHFKSVYFLRLDLGNGTATVTTGNGTSPSVDLGALGFCTNLQDGRGLQCSPSKVGYSLAEASQFINGTLPPVLTNAIVTVASTLTKVLVLHVVAFGIAVISFAFALLAFIGMPIADCCSSSFAVFAFDIAFFEIIKLRVNEDGHGGKAIMGNAVYLTLLAWLLLFVTPIMFLIGRCCACCMPRK
ncbi:hypothetical protein B0H19DRAFT_1255516 [Mycena capillaripes]|nr:hypothetical protein B0H19DRAFT_1255516 [Mycena capillaripes]